MNMMTPKQFEMDFSPEKDDSKTEANDNISEIIQEFLEGKTLEEMGGFGRRDMKKAIEALGDEEIEGFDSKKVWADLGEIARAEDAEETNQRKIS